MGTMRGPYSTEPGPRRPCSQFVAWAEDGRVFLDDTKTGKLHSLTLRAARERCGAFEEMCGYWDKERDRGDPQARAWARQMFEEFKGIVEVMRETIAEAEGQGDPDNPSVRRLKLTSFLRGRRVCLIGDTTGVPSPDYVFRVDHDKPTWFGPTALPPRSKPIAVEPPEKPPGYQGS
jgi:hypothetical protein